MHKLNLAFLLLLLAVAAQPANADGILLTWSPRDITGITEQSFNEAKKAKVEEFKNPYATSIKGLSEIRSREALEALIVSLKSSDKDRLTYIHTYLRTITGIADKNDYDWWKKWWEANMNSLKWNPEQGLFEVAAANKP